MNEGNGKKEVLPKQKYKLFLFPCQAFNTQKKILITSESHYSAIKWYISCRCWPVL